MNRNFGNRDRSAPRDDFRSTPPVNVGEEIDVRIEAVGEKGDGVAKRNGFVIFVPGVKEGQNVRVKVTRVLRKVGFGEVIGDALAPIKEEGKPEIVKEAEDNYSPENDSDNFGEDAAESDSTDADSNDSVSEDFGEDEEDK
ncbi:MAG: TRAM domain-containing protein [Candidatus Woesearchaeota archaeon]|jgi:predicted RNA-binding protein with TRAM domain